MTDAKFESGNSPLGLIVLMPIFIPEIRDFKISVKANMKLAILCSFNKNYDVTNQEISYLWKEIYI